MLVLPAAFAANPWEPGGTLEICLEAVLKERPGIVTGWRQSGGGEMTPYVVSVLNPDGTNAETFCDPAKPTNFQFKNKTGLFRYPMYPASDVSGSEGPRARRRRYLRAPSG